MVQTVSNLVEFRVLINQDKLVVVDFWATWCGPCRVISPVFERLSKQVPEAVFLKVDVDEAADIAQEVGIRSMPTFLFYKNGEKVDELIGANPGVLESKIRQLL